MDERVQRAADALFQASSARHGWHGSDPTETYEGALRLARLALEAADAKDAPEQQPRGM